MTLYVMNYLAEHLQQINKINIHIDSEEPDLYLEYENELCAFVKTKSETFKVNLPAKVRPFPKLALNGQPLRLAGGNQKIQSEPIVKPKQQIPNCVCGAKLVPKNVKFKPLPSEHWAELMDLWHCHKPHTNETNNGMYSLAMNGFHPTLTTAYYSETYYLLHESHLLTHNNNCSLKAPKVWKWDIFPEKKISYFVREILIEKINAHASFTFDLNGLTLWVLSKEAYITSPFENGLRMKVLYTNDNKKKEQRADGEEIILPQPIFTKLVTELTQSTQSLPKGARHMNGWNMALI